MVLQLDLNMSQRTLSMGVLPTVLLKKISCTAVAEMWPRAGSSSSSLPALTLPPAPHTLLARYCGMRKSLNDFVTATMMAVVVSPWIDELYKKNIKQRINKAKGTCNKPSDVQVAAVLE